MEMRKGGVANHSIENFMAKVQRFNFRANELDIVSHVFSFCYGYHIYGKIHRYKMTVSFQRFPDVWKKDTSTCANIKNPTPTR